MSNTFRLLATDLDGTLLHSDNTVSDTTRDAVHRAQDSGIEVVFVTGRPTRWLWEVADAVGFTGVAIAANGALTIDLATESVLHTDCLDSEVLAAVAGKLRAEFGDVLFAVEADSGFVFEHGYVHDWTVASDRDRRGKPVALPEPEELDVLLGSTGVIKLLAKSAGNRADEFLAAATTALGDTVTVTTSARSGLIEISAAGVSKASGLALHAHRVGVEAHEIVAVGDMPNDIPMLEWAGRGYAVANAHPAAKAAADGVLGWSNDEDAVARVLTLLVEGDLPPVPAGDGQRY